MCFQFLQEYVFMSDSAHLGKTLNMGQWEVLHHPKFLPHIPLGTKGIASVESSVLWKRFDVHLMMFWRKITVASIQEKS